MLSQPSIPVNWLVSATCRSFVVVVVLFLAAECCAFSGGSQTKHVQQRSAPLCAQKKLDSEIRTLVSPMDMSSKSGGDPNESRGGGLLERRAVVSSLASAVALGLGTNNPASAYEKTFPMDLDFENGDTSRDLTAVRAAKISQQKKKSKQSMDYISSSNPLFFRGTKDLASSVLWGGALWLLLGSRSNPFITPLANVLYDESTEPWLKDRNEGLFGPLPASFLLALTIAFFFIGIAADRIVLFAAEGDANVCLQLAGVSLIGGGALELGRIASGEKKETREDFDRGAQLEKEFAEFAENRLIPGGNCHRSEVVKSFRRYFAKYRQADSMEYPLSDLEIERLLRNWSRATGNADMSSAGFFTGIQINDQADVFVNR